MIIPDLNVVLYATVQGFALHSAARAWWEETLSGDQPVGIVAPVALGFVRLTTGRRLLTEPMSPEVAIGHVDSWLAQPNVTFLQDLPGTLRLTLGLLRGSGAAGNLTTDAHIAALAIQNRATVATNGADFQRFPDLRTINPLAP